MTDTRLDWLTLHRACATGAAQAWRALSAAGGDIVLAVRRMAVDALGAPAVARARVEAQLDLEWLEANDIALLTRADERYPPLLQGISGAPLLLFVRGDVDALWLPQLAVVGSRQGTAGGLATARDFAATFASRGFAVTSGLAAGIDAAAHQGALDAGGKTIAVLGTGLDRVYPARHIALARRIVEHGALVSEFPPRTPAKRENFPRRNRIISGLSLGVLVVEAARRSGSLITARHAAEQGREVFAIPGSIHNPLSRGCHLLLRSGAKLVESAPDILEELKLPFTKQSLMTSPEAPESTPRLDKEYEILLDALGFDPTGVDAIVERTGLPADSVASMLLILELEGHIAPYPGGRYGRIQQQR